MLVKKLVCIKCGRDWKSEGSPAVCPDCSKDKGERVISAAIVVEREDTNGKS